MKLSVSALRAIAAAVTAVIATTGCVSNLQMDTRSPSAQNPQAVQNGQFEESTGNRVVTGTVELGEGIELPPDAMVAVRVVDVAHRGYRDQNALALGKPNPAQGVTLPPEVIGEQRIHHPTGHTVPFSVHFSANDEQMNGGLVLEARVSFAGKVKYFNVESYAINWGNLTSARRIDVNGVR
jgi:uncharacterized lipoprotein YbaY